MHKISLKTNIVFGEHFHFKNSCLSLSLDKIVLREIFVTIFSPNTFKVVVEIKRNHGILTFADFGLL